MNLHPRRTTIQGYKYVWSLIAGIGNLHKNGWHLVNILETGFSCLGKGSAGKVFPECEILQNLRPAQYIMPLTPSILFPNTNQHTTALRLPPLQASIQPERGEERR